MMLKMRVEDDGASSFTREKTKKIDLSHDMDLFHKHVTISLLFHFLIRCVSRV